MQAVARKRKGDGPDRRANATSRTGDTKPEPAPERAAGGSAPEYTDLVLLVHAPNLAEADLYKTELEAHGIPTILEGEAPSLVGIGAGVPVLVPEEFADQAAELIAEFESAKPEGQAVDEKEDIFESEDRDELEELDELEDLADEDPDDDEEEDEDDVDEDDDWDEEEDEDEDEEDKEEEEEEDEEEWDDDDDL